MAFFVEIKRGVVREVDCLNTFLCSPFIPLPLP